MRPFVVLAAVVASPASVLAWGAAGHEIVATIAQVYLYPETVSAICDILGIEQDGDCHLAPLATWADKVRGLPQYKWSGPYHYANAEDDMPPNECHFPESGWDNANVLAGIRNMTDRLAQGSPNALEALRFLVHFVGDMHQPLHLVGRARGGNDVLVHWDNRQAKFHGVWDNLLIAKAIRSVPPKYNHPLPSQQIEQALRGAIYDPYIREILAEGNLRRWRDEVPTWAVCPAVAEDTGAQVRLGVDLHTPLDDQVACPVHWAREIHPLNCEIVWPKQLDPGDFSYVDGELAPRKKLLELDEPWYSGRLKKDMLVERLLSTAGIRLAAILNDILGLDTESEDC